MVLATFSYHEGIQIILRPEYSSGLFSPEIDNTGVGAWFWLVAIVIIFAWSYHGIRSQTKAFESARAGMPNEFELSALGLSALFTNGTAALTPWPAFNGWRRIGTVFQIGLADRKYFPFLPGASLSEPDRDLLRGTLTSWTDAD